MTIKELKKTNTDGAFRAFWKNLAKVLLFFENLVSKQTFGDKNSELEKFRLVLEQAPGSVFILDNNMNFEYINPCFIQLSGYTEEELLHKNIDDVIYKGKTPQSRIEVIRALRRGEKWQGELLAFHKTGKSYWADTIATPYKDKSGNIDGFVIIQQDITRPKSMEIALRESEELYRTLIDKSINGVALTQDAKIIMMNKAFCDMFGYTEEELENLDPAELLAPEDRERVYDTHYKHMRGLIDTLSYTGLFVHKTGKRLTIEMNSSTVQVNGQNASFVTMSDITEQHALKEALEQSLQRYRELTDMLPQTVYEVDLKGIHTYMNQAGIRTFRHKASPIGLSAFDFIATEDHPRMKENMQKSLAANNFSTGNEYTGVRADGTQFPVIVYGAPIFDKNKVVGTRGIIIDISERKAMENALRESEEKYRTVIDNATDGIVITQQGNVVFSNKAMNDMMQCKDEDVIGKSFLNMVAEEDWQTMIDFHKRRMEGENFSSLYRSNFIRTDGKIITLELNARTSNYNGNPAAFIIMRDISDRVKIENELQKAKQNLEMLNLDLEQRVKESSESLTKAHIQLINLQKENLQSQFDVLKQQVNPHFLFNSLNVLTSLIKLEPDLAEKFSEHLSKVYRYVLENKDNELVDLNTELKFLDAYIFLLNIRFVNKLVVNIDIPESKRCYKVIPLAMQLLIENAIKHNIMSKSNPLHIDIFVDKQNFLNITNNLQERPTQIVSTGIGLKNIQNRYLLLNNTEPVFEKTETQFIAKVPLVNNE